MDELVAWLDRLLVKQLGQTQLAGPLNRMECVTLLARLAMNIGSDAHVYSVRKLVKTMEQAEQLKQSHEGDLPPDVEALYHRLTEKYMVLVETISQQFAIKLLAEVERVPTAPGDGSLMAKVRAWLGE